MRLRLNTCGQLEKVIFYRRVDWNPITKEQILAGTDPLSTYSGTKTFAERAVWEFAAEHPDINITVCEHTFAKGGSGNV